MGMNLSLHQIARLLNCPQPISDVTVTGAQIDTRQLKPGNLFVALKGVHVDGHAFLAQAREAGACAALVSELQDDELPQLLVSDVRTAFAEIARFWCQKSEAKVIAVTGSNGKTSVKEMVSSILRQVGQVTATQGNLNNDLGVPLTVCQMAADDAFAVIEMGANHPDEIAGLVKIAQPDVALINNVAPAHLEGFGSIEGIARAKGEIYSGLKADGVAIVNADMPFSDIWQPLIAERTSIKFGLEQIADITAECIQLDANAVHFIVKMDEVSHHFNLPLPGTHNIANALAAIAICRALNVPVEAMVRGLAAMRAVPHRLQLRSGVNHSRILDDTYNANPGSYSQALTTLSGFDGEHWLVLGDFGELGGNSAEIHRQMGSEARNSTVSRLFTVGENSRLASDVYGDRAEHFEDIKILQKKLESELGQDVVCLIKGSRFMQLDKLADQLASKGEA